MSRGVISTLRDFVPIRPLTRAEAFRIAELQAARLLALSGITDGPVPESIITELPKVHVQRFKPLPVSGATEWSHGRWLVILNGDEPPVRQRFSLAHEAKHIIDHRFIDVLYKSLPDAERSDLIEQVCDYFAGCLLMPRPWLKRAWCGGMQSPRDIAEHFDVSQAAVQVRLSQVGLGERSPRCGRTAPNWLLPRVDGAGTPGHYYRQTASLPT